MAKPKDQISPSSFEQWIERLKEAGFTVQAQDGGRFHISKHGCAAALQPSPSGDPQFWVRPGLLVRAAPVPSAVEGTVRERANQLEPQSEARPGSETAQGIAHLVDRGFQKFWQEGECRIPALSAQLQALHRFEEDLRAVLELTALYNEALGTVSSRYIYDRLEGREKPKRHHPF